MLLEVKNLVKSFEKGKPVVIDVSFDIQEDEIFAFLGPSGCGKTTTLRMIAGFETQDQVQRYLKGEELTSAAKLVPFQMRGISFLFQDYALFPHITALQNVAFCLRNLPRHKKDVFAKEILCRTG